MVLDYRRDRCPSHWKWKLFRWIFEFVKLGKPVILRRHRIKYVRVHGCLVCGFLIKRKQTEQR